MSIFQPNINKLIKKGKCEGLLQLVKQDNKYFKIAGNILSEHRKEEETQNFIRKLATTRDVNARIILCEYLFNVVTGNEDESVNESSIELAKILDGYPIEKWSLAMVRNLANHGGKFALNTLVELITCNSGGNNIKDFAANELYRINAKEELKKIFQKIRSGTSSDGGGWKAVHRSISANLVEIGINNRDVEFVKYIILNGEFTYDGYRFNPLFDFLIANCGQNIISDIYNDPKLFSAELKKHAGYRLNH